MTEKGYVRSAEDSLEVIGHAKHKADDVFPLTQVFYYPPAVAENVSRSAEMRLIDVSEEFITRLEEGESYIFRGVGDEKVVLCSEEQTFDVKEGEISNALVIITHLEYSDQVAKVQSDCHTVAKKPIEAILTSYLEFRPTFPRISKLRTVLTECVYKGPEKEISENEGFYLCELLDVIQCSRGELKKALKEISACCLNGRWRLIDTEYACRLLSQLINLVEERGWDEIPKEESFDFLSVAEEQCPGALLEHIFEEYTVPTADDDNLRKWNSEKVCRTFGEMLLRAGEGKFRHNELMMAWGQCLPKGIEPDVKALRGLALMEQEGSQQQVVHLYPEYSLPENVPERFRQLFKRKEKWTLQEIEPYIEKLAVKGLNVTTMLTKYSRPSTLNGIRVFGARHKN